MLTKDEITKGNKSIAKFLNYRIIQIDIPYIQVLIDNHILHDSFKINDFDLKSKEEIYEELLDLDCNAKNTYHFKFYKSWDWLMFVVEKIQELPKHEELSIYLTGCRSNVLTSLFDVNIAKTFEAVVEFTDKYNDNL